MNVAHVALVETDRFGNPLFKKTIPLLTYGKDRNYRYIMAPRFVSHGAVMDSQKSLPASQEKFLTEKTAMLLCLYPRGIEANTYGRAKERSVRNSERLMQSAFERREIDPGTRHRRFPRSESPRKLPAQFRHANR